MISAKRTDKKQIIEMLSAAFDENLSVNYIVKQGERRKARVRALMDYSFELCSRYGEVFLSDDRKSCALLLYPQLKTTSLKSIWLDVQLILRSIGIGGLVKAMKREALIKEKQPKEPMAYLWFIGVNPMYQHSGIGSKLLKEVIAYAKDQRLPVYLETSTVTNLSWYKTHDFTIYDNLDLGYKLYFLSCDTSK